MMGFILYLFEYPIYIRAAVSVIILLSLWRLFGRVIIWMLSIIPFLLQKAFIIFYLIIKLPITMLHKGCGGLFFLVDNMWSNVGEKIDAKISKWYKKWHTEYTYSFKTALVAGLLFYACIVVPMPFESEIPALNVMKDVYCSSETFLKQKLEDASNTDSDYYGWLGKGEEGNQVELIVYNVNTTLYVRDIPDKENGQALDKLYTGDRVTWTGKMTFVDWGENKEVLINVITENGIEGWSLFDYFYPSDDEEREISVEIE